MHTHEWNNPIRNELLHFSAVRTHRNRSLRILVSLAAGDGVYSIEELRYDLDSDPMPEKVRLIAQHLLDRTGVYDLRDLQLALTEAAASENGSPFCPDGCRCAGCRELAHAYGNDLDDDEDDGEEELTDVRPRRAPRSPQPATGRYALVSIDQIRIYLPDDLDVENEDALDAYVRDNLSRVRQAALECDGTQINVTSVQTVKAAVNA